MLDGAGGTLTAYGADGAQAKQMALPVNLGAWGAAAAAKMEWKLRSLGTVRLAMDPPYEPWTDSNNLRLPFLQQVCRGHARGGFQGPYRRLQLVDDDDGAAPV